MKVFRLVQQDWTLKLNLANSFLILVTKLRFREVKGLA